MLVAATDGTERHSLALEFAVRPLFAYLRAVVLPTGVFAPTGGWGASGAATGGARERGLVGRVDQAAGELAAALPAVSVAQQRP